MSDEKKSSSKTTRRKFLASTAVLSTVSLAGCTSLFNNNDEQTYKDLPEPTYDEVEETPPQDNDDQNTTEEEELTDVEEDLKTFFEGYMDTRKYLSEAIEKTQDTINDFNNRDFDLATSTLTSSALTLQDAKDEFTKQDMQGIATTLNETVDTELDFTQLVTSLDETLSQLQTVLDILHEADFQRNSGNDQEYYDLINKAEENMNGVESSLPPTLQQLYNDYDL